MKILSSLITILSLFLLPCLISAGGTRIWEIAGFDELDKGELKGTTVSSRGEIALGLNPKKLELENVGLVWQAIVGKGGDIYLGTGYDGRVYRVRKNSVTLIANTGQLVVTSLALDKKGDLYLGTLPDPVIWRIKAPHKITADKPVSARKWVTLPEDVEHVWALAFGADGRTLFAGTGPTGKVIAIGPDKKTTTYLDTEEQHILSLFIDKQGALLAGTSPEALLLKVKGPGRFTALEDFEGTEVKAIASVGSELYAAVNHFAIPPAVPNKSKSNPSEGNKPNNGKSQKSEGDGELFRMSAAGNFELVWEEKKAHVVSLAAVKGGRVFAGLGTEGRVISVDADRVVRVELDLDERQVMALVTDKEELKLVGTGDAGAVYGIDKARAKEATYSTPPLDAERLSSWGVVDWFARGSLVFQSRSGNTAEPGSGWSDWSHPLKKGGLITSPHARYLQLRASWAKDRDATLVSAEVAYQPRNLRAVITEILPGSPFPDSKGKSKSREKIEVSERTINARPSDPNHAVLNLSWDVTNEDDDTLRYRLWYRALGKSLWRPILREDDVLTVNRFAWNTTSVPEGRYQIRVRADDSPDNGAEQVLHDELISVPVLVDNHQPIVKGLAFKGNAVVGVAKDSFSAIAAVEFAVDTGPWIPSGAADGLFDETEEAFELTFEKDIEPGPHAVGVRVYDRAGNMGTAEIHVDL